MTSWLGFFAPAGLPPDLRATLHASITKTLKSPQLSARLNDLGLAVVADTPEHFAAQQQADFERRGELVRSNHIRVQ